jgi:uncharacterized membrane protein YdbT with pleckstrin-like domain
MSYVDKNLIPGERVVYRATRQRFGYVWVVVPGVACLYWLAHKHWPWAGGASKRVIVKIGTLERRTVEIMLSKIEGISVEQTILGRLGNAGTVVITGTGGTRESFAEIADPLEFRRQVQGQLARMEDERLQALRGA